MTILDEIQIPKMVQEVLSQQSWKEAVMEEIGALEKNSTWQIIDLPIGKKSVGCK